MIASASLLPGFPTARLLTTRDPAEHLVLLAAVERGLELLAQQRRDLARRIVNTYWESRK